MWEARHTPCYPRAKGRGRQQCAFLAGPWSANGSASRCDELFTPQPALRVSGKPHKSGGLPRARFPGTVAAVKAQHTAQNALTQEQSICRAVWQDVSGVTEAFSLFSPEISCGGRLRQKHSTYRRSGKAMTWDGYSVVTTAISNSRSSNNTVLLNVIIALGRCMGN